MPLTLQKCSVHADRKAVARCPGCANYFCGECVTEHAGKFLCSSCLQRQSAPVQTTPRATGWFTAVIGLSIGLSAAWLFFYLIGRLLILIPPNLHDISYLGSFR
ncbi:MAG: rhomboid family protein [Verrucomicrobia bacterium]|nr:rhomboid family protein [Verrucomicrobiota bacterium]MBV8377890.1 rhomboid family protein [Verrucomicrobiota bacterium]